MMKKLLIVGAILLVAGVGISKFKSHIRTCVNEIGEVARENVPTQFELKRIRNEIAQMENDIERMIKPLAREMTEIEDLRNDINSVEETIKTSREKLLAMTETVRRGESLVINGLSYSQDHAKNRLQQDFQNFKLLETTLKDKRELLNQREQKFEAAYEQVETKLAKKREFELRLARLEAQEERLKVQRIGSVHSRDNNRSKRIEVSLRDIEKRQRTEVNEIKLRKGPFALDPAQNQPTQEVDLHEIENYLQGQQVAPKNEVRVETVNK